MFVHRNTKAEKYISPVSFENSTFTFECKFDELASAEEDLGVWDFFIESSIDGYKLREESETNESRINIRPKRCI